MKNKERVDINLEASSSFCLQSTIDNNSSSLYHYTASITHTFTISCNGNKTKARKMQTIVALCVVMKYYAQLLLRLQSSVQRQ